MLWFDQKFRACTAKHFGNGKLRSSSRVGCRPTSDATLRCETLESRQLLSVTPPISLGDIVSGNHGGTVTSPVVDFNGEQYFAFAPPTEGSTGTLSHRHHQQIWRTDSGTGELVEVVQLPGGSELDTVSHMAAIDDELYFNWSIGVFKTDGTPGHAVRVDSGFNSIEGMVSLGDDLVLARSSGSNNIDIEPHLLDTETGTYTLLKNINNNNQPSQLSSLVSAGDKVYFVASDSIHGKELWRTDGTSSGTVMVQDLRPGTAGSNPTDLTLIGDNLFFIANDGGNILQLWRLDTVSGTMTKMLTFGIQTPELIATDSLVYFQTGGGINRSDGTTAGTFTVAFGVPFGAMTTATAIGDTFYFLGENGGDTALYSSQGTLASTQLVTTFSDAALAGAVFGPMQATSGGIVLPIETTAAGEELYFHDLTAGTTQLLNDIISGPGTSNPQFLLELGSEFFFTADDAVHGNDVWRSDGTPGGTELVDINTVGVGSNPDFLHQVGTTTYMTIDDGLVGKELWKLEASMSTPTFVKDINPGPAGTSIDGVADLGGVFYFTATEDVYGTRLWRSDGTAAGTYVVDSSATAVEPSGSLTVYDNKIYFAGTTAATGTELWSSDGTAAGTQIVIDLRPGTASSDPVIAGELATGLIFRGNDGVSGDELWRTDGTTTELVFDVKQGYNDGGVFSTNFAISDGLMYFIGRPSIIQTVWRTDGTAAGTFDLGVRGIGHWMPADGGLYFRGANEADIALDDLYFTDGTVAGTRSVAEFGGATWTFSSYQSKILGIIDSKVIYLSTPSGLELRSYDPVTETTSLISELPYNVFALDTIPAALDGKLYFPLAETFGIYWPANAQLWETDGTPEGTFRTYEPLILTDPVITGQFSYPVALGDRIYYAAFEPVNGYEPYYIEVIDEAIADAGGPYSGDEGTLIALSGSGSTEATLYEWDLDNDGQYDDATGENVDFDAMDDGVFTIGLRINGVGGPMDSTTVTVNNLAPTASITGTTDIYRGETVSFTLGATDPSPVDQAGLFDFEIDWDGDGSVDETLFAVPSGTTVQHKFSTIAANNIQVRATDKDGATGSFAQTPITVSPHVLRDDGFGNIDLIWGGTDLLDAVYVIGGGPSVSLFVQFEGLQFVNRLDAIGTGVTGKVILHGYAAADVLIGEFSTDHVVEIHGGDGDDVIVGGFLGDELFGDGGNDVILGGTQFTDGDDMLFGGQGKDTIFGHLGADTLDGGGGEDLLISDRYGFSNIAQDVQRIGNEWKSGRPYAERVTNILGITSTGVNGTSILGANVTVAEDNAQDVLIGGLGAMDWFFYDFDEDLLGDVIELDEEETDSNP